MITLDKSKVKELSTNTMIYGRSGSEQFVDFIFKVKNAPDKYKKNTFNGLYTHLKNEIGNWKTYSGGLIHEAYFMNGIHCYDLFIIDEKDIEGIIVMDSL